MDGLRERMAKLGIREEDLDESFLRGTGKGGQKRNKTSACVRIVHRPSGLEVKCQQERSQVRNRALAREWLCDILEARKKGEKMAAQNRRELKRRRNRKRPEGVKRRMIENRYHQSRKKNLRRKPSRDD